MARGRQQATKVTFSRDVTFAGKPVPAGTYAFFVIPTKGAWTVILNKKADQAGTGRDYKEADDLLRVQVTPKAAPFRERLAYLVTDFTDDKASLDLEWEKLRLAIPITVADVGAGAGQHQQRRRQRLADLRQRRPLHAGEQEGLRHRHEVRRPVAGAQGRLVQRLDQGGAAGGQGESRRTRARPASTPTTLGKKSPMFFLEAEVKKTLDDWKKKS